MKIYLDTSVVVASIVQEEASERVVAWLSTLTDEEVLISDWVVTEVSSALSIKVRTGQLDLPQRASALHRFGELTDASLSLLQVTSRNFQTAAGYADRHDLGLRGGDALHLAICHPAGATLVTLDRKMANAGRTLGISTRLV